MTTRRSFLGCVLPAFLLSTSILAPSFPVTAEETIRVGDLNSYNRLPAFTVPYRDGWQMALAEINAASGVLGKRLEIIRRDDGGSAGNAARATGELVNQEHVSILFGTFLSGVGLAVAEFANQNKIVFLAVEPLTDSLTLDSSNRFTFRLRPNIAIHTAMLVNAIEESGITRWAIVAPNYAFGQSSAVNFKQLIEAAIPEAEIITEQYPALGNIDARATVAALEAGGPNRSFLGSVRRRPDQLCPRRKCLRTV